MVEQKSVLRYKRTQSFFDNSELAAKGLPKGEELKILNEYRDELPDEVFNRPFASDKTAGDGNIRPQLDKAFDLLEQAGWTVDDAGVLTHADGTPFIFEILIDSASSGAWQRIILPYVRNLKRLGITAVMRAVDASQYKNRIDHYDYDMIVHVWGQSTSPGNEQRYFWGSKAADKAGAQNYAGIKNRVVDALIEKIAGFVDERMGLREEPSLTRLRHRDALRECVADLRSSLNAPEQELAAEDLRMAMRSLGKITGRVQVEELLDLIFKDFCIGK